jgi:5-methylcytosine-specific restriction endonuclease McrA
MGKLKNKINNMSKYHIRGQPVVKKCVACGLEFNTTAQRKYYKTCSKKCRYSLTGNKKGYKPICSFEKGHIPWNKDKVYNQISGDKHWKWVGGHSGYRGENWNNIRKIVYERDGYSCRKCFKKCDETKLHAHHIIPYRKTNDNSLSNLITLCNSCHMSAENEYRRMGFTHFLRRTIDINKKLEELGKNIFGEKIDYTIQM